MCIHSLSARIIVHQVSWEKQTLPALLTDHLFGFLYVVFFFRQIYNRNVSTLFGVANSN
jgi:hypothetical protein